MIRLTKDALLAFLAPPKPKKRSKKPPENSLGWQDMGTLQSEFGSIPLLHELLNECKDEGTVFHDSNSGHDRYRRILDVNG